MGFLDVFLLLISILLVYWLIQELSRHHWAGQLLKKPSTQQQNISFYLWLLLLFFWIYYAGEFIRSLASTLADSSPATPDEVSRLVTRGITSAFWILFSWLNSLRAKGQPEIREKGFFVSEGFVPWENLRWTQWNDQGHLTLVYRPTLPTPFSKEVRRLWKIQPDEIEDLQHLLEAYAPEGVGQVLIDEKGKPLHSTKQKKKK